MKGSKVKERFSDVRLRVEREKEKKDKGRNVSHVNGMARMPFKTVTKFCRSSC